MALGRQLTLGLSLRDEATFANFYPGDNQPLLDQLQAFVNSRHEPFIFLSGPVGSGRTHLLQACCHAVGLGQAIYLDLADRQLQPEIFADVEYLSLVCLDNIDAVLGQREWELALFNVYNRSRDQGSRLLIAGLVPPARLPCQLEDLRSRFSASLVLTIHPLTDDQKLCALQLRARCRGLELSDEVGKFLLNRCPREMNHLFSLLEKLDQASLTAKRRLTIHFIKQVLIEE